MLCCDTRGTPPTSTSNLSNAFPFRNASHQPQVTSLPYPQVAASPTRCHTFLSPAADPTQFQNCHRVPYFLGDLCHTVIVGSKNAKPTKPAQMVRATCPRCTSPAKASSPKKW